VQFAPAGARLSGCGRDSARTTSVASVHCQPVFTIGDFVRMPTVHFPTDLIDFEFSPRYRGPGVVTGHPWPNLYPIDFRSRDPIDLSSEVPIIMSTWTSCAPVQPRASRDLRTDEQDVSANVSSAPETDTESLVGRQRGRGRLKTGDSTTRISFVSKTRIRTIIVRTYEL
jgi:hypothetical protein